MCVPGFAWGLGLARVCMLSRGSVVHCRNIDQQGFSNSLTTPD